MDLNFTPEDEAFRAEVRAFLEAKLPARFADMVRDGRQPAKADVEQWQHILNERGWLAGLCYPALAFMTVILGWRYALVRLPWQRAYLAVFAAFLGTFCESFIIDTDHWRHYFMIIGIMWGMFAAAEMEIRRRRPVVALPA